MKKIDYLIYCFQQRMYQRKSWLLSAFTLVADTPKNKELLDMDYYPRRDNETKEVFFYNADDLKVVIEDAEYDKPLFHPDNLVTLLPEHHQFITKELNTTIGIMLLNFSLLWEPFKGTVEYHNGEFTSKLLKDIIREVMVDNPKEGETVPIGKASVKDCLKVTNQANFLVGCNNLFVKVAGVDAFTVSKEVIALRDKLISEHTPEQLKDPLIAAKIIDEVVAADMKEMMKGPSKTFFISKKFIDNARKKMFLVFGMERDFVTNEYQFISKPLAEGWDTDHIALYINTAVTAAFDRGKDTGEGGADVKEIIKLTSDIRVTEEDCKTQITEQILITKDSFKNWVGCYHNVSGKPVLITKEDKGLIDTVVNMRTTDNCQTTEGNLCKVCCGVSLGSNPSGVSAECVDIGTVFMLLSMKSAHISQLNTSTIDLNLALC